MLRQIALFDELVRPESVHELIFADHPVAMIDQIEKKVITFGTYRNRLMIPGESPARPVDFETLETDDLLLKLHEAYHSNVFHLNEPGPLSFFSKHSDSSAMVASGISKEI